MSSLSSRERMLAALSCQKTDHVPCCFMDFQVLQKRSSDDFDFFDRQTTLGLDTRVELPDLPIHFDPAVTMSTWKEQPKNSTSPLLHKEYATPSGTITTVVRQTEDWIYGDAVPLFDDYLAPRTKKYLIEKPEDLAALRHLLVLPTDEDIKEFRKAATAYKKYADDKGLLFSGGWRNWRTDEITVVGGTPGTMGIDTLMWLCGGQAPLLWAFDQKDFLKELIDIVATWNRRRMEIILDTGIQLVIKRAWYEGTEFWSPSLYREFIAPVLQEDIAVTHQANAKFGYISTSGTLPILDQLMDMELDAIIGVDPGMGKGTDMQAFASQAKDKLCLWGGVNAPLSVEEATTPEIENAVETALSTFEGNNGFILSPVDNILNTSKEAWENVLKFIEVWKSKTA